MKKGMKVSVILFMLMIIVACNKNDKDVTKDINQYIEDTVDIEMQFEESQEDIEQLEERDQEIYDEIIQLGSEDYDEIVALADEAIKLLKERLEIVDLEKESIEAAREEFEQIDPLIEKVEEEAANDKAQKMYDAMIARYDAYDDVYKHYTDSIRLTEDLYTVLKEEEFQEKEVYSLIADVNDSYEEVAEAFDIFNSETSTFNHMKQEYYEYVTKD